MDGTMDGDCRGAPCGAREARPCSDRGKLTETISYGPEGEIIRVRSTFGVENGPSTYDHSMPPNTLRRFSLRSRERSREERIYEAYV